MDDQQRQRMNRAAQEFTDALVAAYRTASDNTAVAQQLGAQQIEYFFDAVVGNLRAQAGGTSQMARQLASQQRLAQEATRDLAQLSTDNYMDLLDSVFSFYQGGASRTQRRADEARGHIERRPRRGQSRPRHGPRRPNGPGARPRARPRRLRRAPAQPRDGPRKRKKGPVKPKAGPRRPRNGPSRPRENLRKRVGASKKPRGAPWKPSGAGAKPSRAGAKPKAGEATKRATRRPTPQANRRALRDIEGPGAKHQSSEPVLREKKVGSSSPPTMTRTRSLAARRLRKAT